MQTKVTSKYKYIGKKGDILATSLKQNQANFSDIQQIMQWPLCKLILYDILSLKSKQSQV